MLSKELILKQMNTAYCGKNLIYLDETDSTNEYAKKIAATSESGTLVVADCQKKGKGRLGRNWNSPAGTCIYMSLILKERIEPHKSPMVTLIAAMAVFDAVREKLSDVKIKWPNDIVVGGKKITGILTEMKSDSQETEYIVPGIGINVNNEEFAPEIAANATSMKIEAGRDFDRSILIANVMKYFEKYYDEFLKTGDLSFIKEIYNDNLVNRNNEVEIISGEDSYRAAALGIDDSGALIVRKKDTGEIHTVVSGEVSVRGVYGYV